MGFKFKKRERLRKGFRRLAMDQLRKALKQSHGRDQMRALHEVRKTIKRTRAFLRLFRPCLKKRDYGCCAKLLRDSSKLLSAARDARVKIDTLNSLKAPLAQVLSPIELSALRRVLAQQFHEHQRNLAVNKTIPCVRRLLKRARRCACSIEVRKSGWAGLAPGIENSYRTGQSAFEELKTHPLGEHFHECRKRVKDLYYQLGFLQSIQPVTLARTRNKLERLGECLGDDHDLLILAESALSRQGEVRSRAKNKSLQTLIARRQKNLRAEALRLGSECFHQSPSEFCKTLERYWKAWRKKPNR